MMIDLVKKLGQKTIPVQSICLVTSLQRFLSISNCRHSCKKFQFHFLLLFHFTDFCQHQIIRCQVQQVTAVSKDESRDECREFMSVQVSVFLGKSIIRV